MAEKAKTAPASGFPGPPGGRHGMSFEKPKNLRGTLTRISGYMRGGRRLLAIAALCVLVSSGSSIAATMFLRPIINDYILPGDFPGLAIAIGKLGLIMLAGILAGYLQGRMMTRLAHRTTNAVRRELFDKLQGLPLRTFDTRTHGELMSRFTNDADNIQTMLEQSLPQFISSAMTLIGCVACMLFLSPVLFMATTLSLAVMFVAVGKIGKRSRVLFQKQQELLGKLNGNIEENLGGLKEIKAFNHEAAAKAEFEELNLQFRDTAKNAHFLAGIMMPIVSNLNNVSYALTAVFGGMLAVFGRFDIGALASYLQFSRQVGFPIAQISGQMNQIFAAAAGAERIFGLMDEEPEADEGKVVLAAADDGGWLWRKPDGSTTPLRGDVRFHAVDFAYTCEKPVLKNISLYAKPGQMIAFVGSTGAGKTTITNLINRFYDIESGAITYDGVDVREIEKDSLRRSLGMVLQDTRLFTGTILDNIRYGKLDATDEECITAAKKANAHSFIRKLEHGYETVLEGDGGNLSQGQRQLIAIARAYISQPPVLILDEATSSIDTRTEQLVQKGMNELMKNRTVFVIAHRLSTVRGANAIIVLEKGEIIERGTHEELLAQEGRYYQLHYGLAELN